MLMLESASVAQNHRRSGKSSVMIRRIAAALCSPICRLKAYPGWKHLAVIPITMAGYVGAELAQRVGFSSADHRRADLSVLAPGSLLVRRLVLRDHPLRALG